MFLLDSYNWIVGIRNQFSVSPGKYQKYLPLYLTQSEVADYAATCPKLEKDTLWRALFAMCQLFRSSGREVGAALGFSYPEQDDAAMTGYLEQVRQLPDSPSQ